MDMATALADLGVTEASIDTETMDRLDRDGYAPAARCPVRRAGDGDAVRLDELVAAAGDRAGIEVHQEVGTDRLADLINKGPVFDVCFSHPRVLACTGHVLGDFKLSSLNSRAVRSGQGHQALHAGTAAPRTAPASRAAPCTPTSPAGPTVSNSTSRSTSARKPWPS